MSGSGTNGFSGRLPAIGLARTGAELLGRASESRQIGFNPFFPDMKAIQPGPGRYGSHGAGRVQFGAGVARWLASDSTNVVGGRLRAGASLSRGEDFVGLDCASQGFGIRIETLFSLGYTRHVSHELACGAAGSRAATPTARHRTSGEP